MLVALVDQLTETGWRPTIVSYGTEYPWSRHPALGLRGDLDHLRAAGAAGKAALLVALLRSKRVDCLGADLLDGFYQVRSATRRLWLLHLAARLGKEATALGFSFNREPAPAVLRRFKRLPSRVNIRVRDPLSAARFEDLVGRRVTLVADLAFLLEAEESSATATIDAWIDRQHDQGRRVIGINANALLGRREHDAHDADIVPFYADGLEELAMRDDIALLFLPHDYRTYDDRPSDQQLVARLQRALTYRVGEQLATRSHLVTYTLTARELRQVAGRCDAVVTGRMHLAIAALSQAVPTVTLAYQGKVEGLYRYFGLDGLVVEPDAAPSTLRDALEWALGEPDQLRREIERHLPEVRELAAANLHP